MTTSRKPVCIPATGGPVTRTPWGDTVREVVPANQSTGAFSTLLVEVSPSRERPGYVHHAADEAFVVLSGSVTFAVGGEDYPDLRSGASVYVPRGMRREYTCGPDGARLLVTQTPGWAYDGPRGLLAAPDPGADAVVHYARAMAGCGVEVLAPTAG
jgi:mannose-6-phosphate isomerase-like protein (cupin superfamily)